MTKNDIQYLLNKDLPNIFETTYVSNVLGITTTLNENYVVINKREIIEEQLILEGWWDDLKNLPGNLKEIFSTLKKVVSDPKYVNKWVTGIKASIITKDTNKIIKFLEDLIGSSENKLSGLAKELLNKLKGFFDKVYSMSGWKLAIAITALGLAVQWLWKKFGKMITSGIKSLGGDAIKELLTGLGNEAINSIGSMLNSFSGVGALVSWGIEAFKGAKFIIDKLGPAVEGFNIDDSGYYLKKHENMDIVKNLLKENLHIEGSLNELNDELDFSAFKMNDALNPYIWRGEEEMGKVIKKNLIKIANDYWESLELGFKYKDITMTGSLANYNWSKYSDVDLHIIFDINELGENEELVKELLDVKTRKWNEDHNITVKGFEVELYLQPEDQPHHSSGVYSLLDDSWITKPEKQNVRLDKDTIRAKYKTYVKTVNDIKGLESNEEKITRLNKLKDKISTMRKAGLEANGEFSVENIVFKLLRRNDIMELVNDILTQAYDDSVTIDEIN